jgi:hypothetical protein
VSRPAESRVAPDPSGPNSVLDQGVLPARRSTPEGSTSRPPDVTVIE